MERALYLPPFGTLGDVNLLVELAVEAEAAGWDGFFLWDHILPSEPGMPLADSWIALAAIAHATERVRIGPLVTPLSRRRPWKVAREATTLDHLSGGRMVLGVGLGVDFWREFSAFGEAADDRERAELVDDGIEIVDRLWSGEAVDHEGSRLGVRGARFLPVPVQQPRIPIWTAALWPLRPGPAARAERWDGIMPFNPAGVFPPEDAAELRARYPDKDICLHRGHQIDAAEYADAGVTWLTEPLWPDIDLAHARAIVTAGP